jgi:hypothetical protein
LTERLELEAQALDKLCLFANFTVMLIFYCAVLYTYDPANIINSLHLGLKSRFHLLDENDGPMSVQTPADIMTYTQNFIEASRTLASALVDANTMESIDLNRCLSDEVSDVCALNYWTIPSLRKAPNWLNRSQIDEDKLSPQNAKSVMDCSAASPRSNCIDRNSPTFVAPDVERRTFGLTPEDPIIMDSLMDYPLASVVPLSPIVWQTRAKVVPCDGFGNKYNSLVLGAGLCAADIDCDPSRVTEFFNTQKNLKSNRTQSLFITYEEPAFVCVDRKQEADAFLDKSWSPWADYNDLTEGRVSPKGELDGEQVFYKFVSDVAYLQAPFQLYLTNNGQGSTCNASKMLCNKNLPNCDDPLNVPEHEMWSEIRERSFECSFHDHYSREFLLTPPADRKIRFSRSKPASL